MLSPHLQQLSFSPARKHWLIAYAGAANNVRKTICRLCLKHSTFRFCGQTASTTQLVREVSPLPDIVLMDDALLNRHDLTELVHLHCALPSARTLLIGDSLQLPTLLSALRLGTWGVLAKMRLAVDLDRALYAVAGGELWLSRRHLTTMVVSTHGDLNQNFWNLTPRENAAVHQALLGQSNKQIARSLDIAEHTVKIHLYHAYAKLHVRSRVELLLNYGCDIAHVHAVMQ